MSGDSAAKPGAAAEATSAAQDEHGRYEQEGARIAELLSELQPMTGPQAWPKVEELLARTVALYGEGLGRALRHAREAGAGEAALAARVAEDPLLSSLLLLHGLHPLPLERRVQGALAALRPQLEARGVRVELLELSRDALRIAVHRESAGCASSSRTVAEALERALNEAAPEIGRLAIEDARAESANLVQLAVGPRRRP